MSSQSQQTSTHISHLLRATHPNSENMARQPRTVTNLTTKTYPSADGSPVHRTSSFWFLPGSPNLLASSPASSGQSMRVGQRSEASFEARQEWKVLMAYGPEGRRREILEGEFRWLIEVQGFFVSFQNLEFQQDGVCVYMLTKGPGGDTKCIDALSQIGHRRGGLLGIRAGFEFARGRRR